MPIDYKFNAKDFRKLLETQKGKCYLTSRELTPENTNAEHILPLRKGGKHKVENICLVIDMVGKLKRYFTEEEIVLMSVDIIKTRGKKYGYTITKKSKGKNK